MIFRFAVLVLFCLLTINAYPQNKLTLDEAIKIALQKNTFLQQSENNVTSLESNVTAAYGNFLPSLGAFGSWGWDRNEQAGSVRYFGGVPFNIPPSTTENRSYNAGLSSDVTLFDGLSNFSTLSQSKNDLQSAEYSLEFLKQQVVINTIVNYYNLMTQMELLKVREENVVQQKKNLETIEERNRLGAVTLADVYQQQVQLGNAELQVIRQNLEVEKAKNNLLIYLGLDVSSDYAFESGISGRERDILSTDIEKDYSDFQTRVNDALNNRKDYQSKILELESSLDGVTIARSGHFPRLSGNLGFTTFANRFDDLFDSKTYSVGLSLNIPIFSGFSVNNRVQFAEVQAMNKELELTEMERTIKQEINEAYLNLVAAKKSLTVSEKNVKAAEENLKIEQERYNLGSGKLLDVLIANTSYISALTDFVNSQYAYIIVSDQIKYFIGTLDYTVFE